MASFCMKTSLFLFSRNFFSPKRFSLKKDENFFHISFKKSSHSLNFYRLINVNLRVPLRKTAIFFSCLLYFYFFTQAFFLLLTTYSVILFFQNRGTIWKIQICNLFSPLLVPLPFPPQFLVQEIRIERNGRMQVSTSIKYLNIFQGLES